MSPQPSVPADLLERVDVHGDLHRHAEQLVAWMTVLERVDLRVVSFHLAENEVLRRNIVEMLRVFEGKAGEGFITYIRVAAPDVAPRLEAMREPALEKGRALLRNHARRQAARQMAEAAARAGVQVTEDAVYASIQRIPVERLDKAVRQYVSDIAQFQAAGIDLNDPDAWEGESVTLEEAIAQGLV